MRRRRSADSKKFEIRGTAYNSESDQHLTNDRLEDRAEEIQMSGGKIKKTDAVRTKDKGNKYKGASAKKE